MRLVAPVFGYHGLLAERARLRGVNLPEGLLTAGVKAFRPDNGQAPDPNVRFKATIDLDCRDYARLLAKIVYGHIVAAYGLESIAAPYVVDAILGRSDDVMRWVGCEAGSRRRLPERRDLIVVFHNVGYDVLHGEFLFWIRLFDNFGKAPEYLIIVGRATETLRDFLIANGHPLA